MPGVFTIFTAAFQRHGHVYRAADGTAAALWVPPGVDTVADDEARVVRCRASTRSAALTRRYMFAISSLLDENHPHDPVWYLNFVGVEPAVQGRGLGSALLEHVLTIADREQASAYLDATTTRNRALYERHGFAVSGELVVPDGPTLWPMWREPQRR